MNPSTSLLWERLLKHTCQRCFPSFEGFIKLLRNRHERSFQGLHGFLSKEPKSIFKAFFTTKLWIHISRRQRHTIVSFQPHLWLSEDNSFVKITLLSATLSYLVLWSCLIFFSCFCDYLVQLIIACFTSLCCFACLSRQEQINSTHHLRHKLRQSCMEIESVSTSPKAKLLLI